MNELILLSVTIVTQMSSYTNFSAATVAHSVLLFKSSPETTILQMTVPENDDTRNDGTGK